MKVARLIQQVQAFGWEVSNLSLDTGAVYRYIIPTDIHRSRLPAVSIWTRGRVAGVNLTTGNQVADRVPGVLTSDLSAAVRAGRYELTATEPSEWWCVASKLNGGQLPRLRAVVLSQSQILTLEQPAMLLVCSGSINGLGPGQSGVIDTSLMAAADSIGVIFDRSRP